MSDLIRIKRKYLGRYLVISPSWVSNGCWAIRRDRVTNMALLASKDVFTTWMGYEGDWREMPDAKFSEFFKPNQKAFTVTRITTETERGAFARLLVADGEAAWVDDDYLTLLKIRVGDVLFSEGIAKPFHDGTTEEDSTIVLMAVTVDHHDLMAQLRRWLSPDPPLPRSAPVVDAALPVVE